MGHEANASNGTEEANIIQKRRTQVSVFLQQNTGFE